MAEEGGQRLLRLGPSSDGSDVVFQDTEGTVDVAQCMDFDPVHALIEVIPSCQHLTSQFRTLLNQPIAPQLCLQSIRGRSGVSVPP